jgi:uncharacterized protein (TIGR00730 family)
MTQKVISVFGTSRAAPGSQLYQLAYELGSHLARAGLAIANGGYNGTMRAAAHGASDAHGEVIGVTCSAFKRAKANEYVTREISTASLDERLSTLIKLGDAYVILPGGTGTLLELAHVWELKNKHFMNPAKPVILLGRFWEPVVKLVESDDKTSSELIQFADDPLSAAATLKAFLDPGRDV